MSSFPSSSNAYYITYGILILVTKENGKADVFPFVIVHLYSKLLSFARPKKKAMMKHLFFDIAMLKTPLQSKMMSQYLGDVGD